MLKKVFSTVFRSMDMESYDPGFHFRGHMNKVPNNLNFSVKKRDSFQSTRMALDGSSRTHSGYFTSTAERDDCLLRKPANQGNFGNLLFGLPTSTTLSKLTPDCVGKRRSVLAFCGNESLPSVTPDTLWEKLRPVIHYLDFAELAKVRDALEVAFDAHDGQRRKSGEPFIIHPVEVAVILGELEMDWESVAAGLLHDTVEDTDKVTFDTIEKRYGMGVRKIVEGETKVSKIGKMKSSISPSQKKADMKANDMRQMFMAMTEEIRVIIVKLADRLHNMRTLVHMPPHKQKNISMETLEVFARLAKLLGLYGIKSELEELSFMYAYPNEYADIKRRMDVLIKEQEKVVIGVKDSLKELIEKDQSLASATEDIKLSIFCKEPYSIFKKMTERKCSLEDIRDISQIHIVIKQKPGDTSIPERLCYHVLGLCHRAGRPVPQRVKDYIATPKPNGYRSLHTTILPKDSTNVCFVEIQIRTEEMEKMAERGVVAVYNTRNPEIDARSWWLGGASPSESGKKGNFLNSLREWSNELFQSMPSPEFVNVVKEDLLSRRVFVFSPKGDVKYLTEGATVVDYAYLIHTDVGNQMIGAKVNGCMVPPTHVLSNAEVVEVITYPGPVTSKGYQAHQQWLKTVVNKSSRYKIMKFLKDNAHLFPHLVTQEKEKSKGETQEQKVPQVAEVKVKSAEGTLVLEAQNGAVRALPVETDLPEPPKSVVHANGKSNGAASSLMRGEENGPGKCLTKYESKAWTQGMENVEFKKAIGRFRKMEEQTMTAWASVQALNSEDGGSHEVQWVVVDCLDRTGLLAQVSTLLSEEGLLICTHFGQTEASLGIGAMIFAVQGREGTDLLKAVTKLQSVECVLSYSVKTTEATS